MESLVDIREYSTFKQALDTEIQEVASGFVRAGYLLKVARDTNILEKSGYKTVAEFALAEYGLKKDTVSRWIGINDRYSVAGYSDRLQDRYKGFGVAKLAEMLTLPDYIADNFTPEVTRSDIQDVKRELEEEKKITDIEVMLESKDQGDEGETVPFIAMKLFWSKRPRAYRKMYALAINADVRREDIGDIIAPNGMAIAFARPEGMGKIQITIKVDDDRVSFTNMRNGECQDLNVNDILNLFIETFSPCLVKKPEEAWKLTYNEDFPTLNEDQEKTDRRTESKLFKEEKVGKNVDKHSEKSKEVDKKREVAPVQQKKEVQKDVVIDKTAEEKQIEPINTECETTSTTKISTNDNRRMVYEEIKNAAAKMCECLDRSDITGAERFLKDINDMFASMAADKDVDIPGQMNIQDAIGGTEDGREDS